MSKRCPTNLQEEASDQLGVNISSGHMKYLGFPLLLGKGKISHFRHISDKIWNQVTSWNSSKLSVGGKEVLIKSMLSAVPQFVMSCYFLLVQILNKMMSHILKIWWASGRRSQAIHWVKKDVLFQPKELGGMSFREFKSVKISLLTKHVDSLLNNPNSFVSRLIKAKYMPRSDFHNATLGYKPSPFRRSICQASKSLATHF